ncbi:hypothetical protein H0H93_003344 [Arthromyces matolae]|nr:hypothetical protein H0H93_003344 [Arthromyces matolae]
MAVLKPGDIVDIPGLFKVEVITPMGGELPAEDEVPPSQMTPTHKSSLYGHHSGDAFELGNDASDVFGGVVHISDSFISGLELRFFGRKPLKVGGSQGEGGEFDLERGEYISGVQGTFDTNHLTSLTFVTNKQRLNYGTPVGSTFSWSGSAGQVLVGLSGFSGDYINGLSVIYVDISDEPPYDPTKDANIEALASREILLPEVQGLYRKNQYDQLHQRRAAFRKNMDQVYKAISDMVDSGKDPWNEVVDSASGKTFLLHYDDASKSSVYIYATQGTPISDQLHITVGQISPESGWTETTNYFIRGALQAATWLAVARGFARFFAQYLLKKGAQFVGSALDVLGSRLIASGVLKSTARMFARLVGGALRLGFIFGLEILGQAIGLLIAWGVDALVQYLLKTYYLGIRIYNHDGRLVDWTPTSFYGYNEIIAAGVDWRVEAVPKLTTVGTSQWVEGIGWVTADAYVGAYNCYSFENQYYGAGLAVAMTAQRPNTSDSVNLMYRVAKGANNSMGLNWGNENDQTYLDSGKDKKVNYLSIDTPVKVMTMSPELWSDPENVYTFSVFLGELPPPKA